MFRPRAQFHLQANAHHPPRRASSFLQHCAWFHASSAPLSDQSGNPLQPSAGAYYKLNPHDYTKLIFHEKKRPWMTKSVPYGSSGAYLPHTEFSEEQPQFQAKSSKSLSSKMNPQAQDFQPPKEKKGRKSKYAKRKEQEAADIAETAKDRREFRRTPSKASGGVPEPSATYMLQASAPPKQLPAPRKILIVMDLNGTLLHRPIRKLPMRFTARPHAKHFLRYCLDTFYLAIWSSARPANVHKMVSGLLTPEQRESCLLVWSRDQFGLSEQDYDLRVQCYKRLERIWDDPRIIASHPDAANGGRWDQSNTILVDDSEEKARSEPYNILALPEFTGLENEVEEVLPQVHDYLNTLAWQEDISRYMRENKFHLSPTYSLPSREPVEESDVV